MSAFGKNTSTPHDSTTVFYLTDEEVELFHRIYDGRDECYDHFVRAVKAARYYMEKHDKLKRNNKQLERLLEQYQIDELGYEEALELSAEDLSTLSSALHKLEKKVNRKNTFIYILSGAVLAETIALVTFIALP